MRKKLIAPCLNEVARPGVDNPQLLVLARRGQPGAVPVETKRIDRVRVQVQHPDGVPLRNVPNNEKPVESGGDEDAVGSRMPLNVTDASRVAVQVDEPLVEDGCACASRDAAVGNVPKLDCAVV